MNKKILAILMTLSISTGLLACSSNTTTPTTITSATTTVTEATTTEISEMTTETTEDDGNDRYDEEEISEFYSLDGLNASEIKTILEQYYTELVPRENSSADKFRLSLPKVPERLASDKTTCLVSYTGLDTNGHSRISYIVWEGYTKQDNDIFAKAEVKNPKTKFDLIIKGKDTALELLDLYRQEIKTVGFEQVNDQNQGDIWSLSANSNFKDQIGTKTISVLVSPATTEGDDFWKVTVKHFYEIEENAE
jgi:hypothetical protein